MHAKLIYHGYSSPSSLNRERRKTKMSRQKLARIVYSIIINLLWLLIVYVKDLIDGQHKVQGKIL